MAYGEQLTGDSPLAYTIHVWPTRELVARSWGWPECWRAAYEEFAWLIGLAVATQVLEGGSFSRREVKISTSIGCVRFAISQAGSTVHITISDFAGPRAPGPDGGITQQPTAIGGLVLGLRGANRYFHVVVFHGVIPDIAVSDILPSRESRDIPCNACDVSVAPVNQILSRVSDLELKLGLNSPEFVCGSIDCDPTNTYEDAPERENSAAGATLRMLLMALISHELKIQFAVLPDLGTTEWEGFGLFCRILEWKPWSYGLPAPPDVYRQLHQRQSDRMHGRHLH